MKNWSQSMPRSINRLFNKAKGITAGCISRYWKICFSTYSSMSYRNTPLFLSSELPFHSAILLMRMNYLMLIYLRVKAQHPTQYKTEIQILWRVIDSGWTICTYGRCRRPSREHTELRRHPLSENHPCIEQKPGLGVRTKNGESATLSLQR